MSAAQFARWQLFLEMDPPVGDRLDLLAVAMVNALGPWMEAAATGKWTPISGRFYEWDRDPEELREEQELLEQRQYAAAMAGSGLVQRGG